MENFDETFGGGGHGIKKYGDNDNKVVSNKKKIENYHSLTVSDRAMVPTIFFGGAASAREG